LTIQSVASPALPWSLLIRTSNGLLSKALETHVINNNRCSRDDRTSTSFMILGKRAQAWQLYWVRQRRILVSIPVDFTLSKILPSILCRQTFSVFSTPLRLSVRFRRSTSRLQSSFQPCETGFPHRWCHARQKPPAFSRAAPKFPFALWIHLVSCAACSRNAQLTQMCASFCRSPLFNSALSTVELAPRIYWVLRLGN
jgi:hypothetical protein